ncbi:MULTISPECIES: hypothetical protein [unclassified Acidiplasma]|uniref:hypothetical protein n=1 Tax=unclassified Acidiplasma TaxID=2641301 RepID=UPI0012E02380|nr:MULTISPECIES: hypothetical protein [unclassified Acidiplasma]WMT55512.1 MAG: hypothetical protein RE470_02435 [Acidiplasma sp.]
MKPELSLSERLYLLWQNFQEHCSMRHLMQLAEPMDVTREFELELTDIIGKIVENI